MKKRRAQRELRNQAMQKDRQIRAQNLLIRLDVWDELDDPNWRNIILRRAYYPPIQVTCSQHHKNGRSQRIQRELEAVMSIATFDCPVLGNDYPIIDYFMHVKPLTDLLRELRTTPSAPRSLLAKLEKLDSLIASETAEKARDRLFYDFDMVLMKHSRMDHEHFYLEWDPERRESGKLEQRCILNCASAKLRTIIKDNEPRRAFQCGQPVLRGVDWVEWPSSVIDDAAGDTTYPVVVQSHALKMLHIRLHDFLSRQLEIEDCDGLLQLCLWASLKQPRLCRMARSNEKFLIEYYLGDYKVGYLVASRYDEIILLETFLFLTMDGTPEGDELWRQLRLERFGKQTRELDKLSTFVETDVAVDTGLVDIFSRCGCRHLFEMRKAFGIENFMPGYATDIRKYLCLTN